MQAEAGQEGAYRYHKITLIVKANVKILRASLTAGCDGEGHPLDFVSEGEIGAETGYLLQAASSSREHSPD